jgi:hypothetical protein
VLQQSRELLELLELPPAPPRAVVPPEAEVPPEPPTGASTAKPPALVVAPLLPALDEAAASGALPNSCVPPPQPASTVAVIKLTVKPSQRVFVMSC